MIHTPSILLKSHFWPISYYHLLCGNCSSQNLKIYKMKLKLLYRTYNLKRNICLVICDLDYMTAILFCLLIFEMQICCFFMVSPNYIVYLNILAFFRFPSPAANYWHALLPIFELQFITIQYLLWTAGTQSWAICCSCCKMLSCSGRAWKS